MTVPKRGQAAGVEVSESASSPGVAVAKPSSIRAGYTKLALKLLRQERSDTERSLVLRAIGDEKLAKIRSTGALGFLPARYHAAVADATMSSLGQRAAREFWRDVMLSSFDRALLKPIVRGAFSIYGRRPSSIMRMTPQAWSLVWRNCGRSWMDRDDAKNQAVMHFDDLPPVMCWSTGIIESFVSNCDAALEYCKKDGKVSPDYSLLKKGGFRIEVTWD